jgi:opacity protein-like surface antigen
MLNKKIAGIIFVLALVTLSAQASEVKDEKFRYPFYAGITGGYGSTTWFGLVPAQNKANGALALSTPTNVSEGGGMWGFFAGYEFMQAFAMEINYNNYPRANVYFSPRSMFSFQHPGTTHFYSDTVSYGLMAKVMVTIPTTAVRFYSSGGIAAVHRHDVLSNLWRTSPTFGLGLNYNFTPHIMGEFGGNYTGGYGESELTPATDYIPFLYSIFMRLAYRF